MYQALSATSATLRQMIFDAMMSDAGPGGLASFFGASQDISLLSPREMRDATRDGLSIWLYSVERDDQRINEPPRTRVLPGGRLELQANPLPLRLHYLITPLATNAPDIEQRMLGRVMQLFHTRPAVSGALLRGELAGSDVELHVHLESLGLDQIARVWEALEGSYQLCISYEVSLARIEVSTDPVTLVPVETLRTDTAIVIDRSAA